MFTQTELLRKTGTNQPLDVSINGSIKSICKKIAKQALMDDPFSKPLISDAINGLIKSEELIKK